MNDMIHDLAEVTDDYAVTFDLAFALLDKIPAPVAARALLAICDEHEIDWTSEVTDEVALGVKELVSEPESARVATPYGDLVARTYDDSGTYMGIIVDLEKPDGTSGQVSITEAVADAARDVYPTPIHTFAYDGVHEDCAATTERGSRNPSHALADPGSSKGDSHGEGDLQPQGAEGHHDCDKARQPHAGPLAR